MTKNKKKWTSYADYRSRISVANQPTSTPIRRPTGVSGGSRSLAINTSNKSPKQSAKSAANALDRINNLKTKFLTSEEEMNCAYLWHKLGKDLSTQGSIYIPQSILSEKCSKEIFISSQQNTAPKRGSAKSVMKRTAKHDFQMALKVIMQCDEISKSDKLKFKRFFQLYDINNPENKKIPSAEWCHMIAMSLSTNTSTAMAVDNLFAATAMANTKMINFENSAKRLAQDGYVVKLETEYVTFKGTATLARLTQIITVTDQQEHEHRFEQKINLFEVNKPHQATSRQDPKHVYNYIIDAIKNHKPTPGSNTRPLLFDGYPAPKKLKFDPENTTGEGSPSKSTSSKRTGL